MLLISVKKFYPPIFLNVQSQKNETVNEENNFVLPPPTDQEVN